MAIRQKYTVSTKKDNEAAFRKEHQSQHVLDKSIMGLQYSCGYVWRPDGIGNNAKENMMIASD